MNEQPSIPKVHDAFLHARRGARPRPAQQPRLPVQPSQRPPRRTTRGTPRGRHLGVQARRRVPTGALRPAGNGRQLRQDRQRPACSIAVERPLGRLSDRADADDRQ